jgi:trk system potassium uptake protein TrkA
VSFDTEQKIMAERQIVVVGCGRLGGLLANKLSNAGNSVVVVDRKEIAFDKLSPNFSGYRVLGDAVEFHVMQMAKVDRADYLFATTMEDNTNLMVAQVAKYVFNVKHVIARVYDPARETLYDGFGIATINPTLLSADKFLSMVK